MRRFLNRTIKNCCCFIVLSCSFQLQAEAQKDLAAKLKTSLNAYSFNSALMKGEMDLDDLLEYCAANQFDAVDLTAYYFPGYPQVPSDAYLYHIKQKAFRLGLEISGTGVRNDFTDPDPAIRRAGMEVVKNWIIAAEKMGAPVIRVFSGTADPKGLNRSEVLSYLVADLKECTEFGKAHGVMVAVQNHDDFIRTADQAIEVVGLVNSAWFGLILDIGSYRTGDLYDQVARSIPYAVSWQLKEKVYVDGVGQEADLDRLMGIIMNSGYRGYLPIETLGEGDPKVKVARFLNDVRKAIDRRTRGTKFLAP